MAEFSVHDNRGGKYNPNKVYEDQIRKAGVSFEKVRQADQASMPAFGDPRVDHREMFKHLSERKLATKSAMQRTAASGAGHSSIMLATQRPHDPMWYWKQNNIPIDFTDANELKRIREFCNTPDAPITMADNTTKAIGDVVAGDMVMGWTYLLLWNGGQHRRHVPSRVIATSRRIATNVVRLTMASGATVQCTADHKWFNPHYTKPLGNEVTPYAINYQELVRRQSTEYRVADIGTELLAITDIQEIYSPGNWMTSALSGDMTISNSTMDKVIAIEEIGEAEVVSLQTETGNYIAWGYASKNCRLLYATHPIVSACIDVYSKLPMQGLHFKCKDPQLVDFYSELFFDQLDYEEHLLKMGRQYWLLGESWSLGGWNETLGVWEEDELIYPDDVTVEKTLFQKEPRYLMKLPENLRKILTSQQPHHLYVQLVKEFPELVQYASTESQMPVSNIVLKQMRFEADDFSNRGIPILMRAMRTLIQEEMLNSALDAIADRLYTPLILAKLGASAKDLGGTVPWVPSQDEMEDFNLSMDSAMAADFRLMTYHWALEIESVFGRENVPDLSNDFDRIVERILMVFGLSQTMLTGASAGETYAADALNRDVVTQLLSHYQKMMKRFVRARAEIVAEASGHFDYEVRNGMRYLQTEEIYEVDEETGEARITEIPKLLVPELEFKVLNLTDEEQERQFVESLAEANVPVPYRARLLAAGMDFDEVLEQRKAEAVTLAVAQAETERETYLALKRAGLPITQDLQDKFNPKAIQPGTQTAMVGDPQPLPGLGEDDNIPALAPDPEATDEEDQGIDPATGAPMDGDPNEGQDVNEQGDPKNRPEESDEERADMPKKAAGLGFSKEAVAHEAAFQRFGRREIVEATNKHYEAPDNSKEDPSRLQDWQPGGRFATPKHVGMRRHISIPTQLRDPDTITSDEEE